MIGQVINKQKINDNRKQRNQDQKKKNNATNDDKDTGIHNLNEYLQVCIGQTLKGNVEKALFQTIFELALKQKSKYLWNIQYTNKLAYLSHILNNQMDQTFPPDHVEKYEQSNQEIQNSSSKNNDNKSQNSKDRKTKNIKKTKPVTSKQTNKIKQKKATNQVQSKSNDIPTKFKIISQSMQMNKQIQQQINRVELLYLKQMQVNSLQSVKQVQQTIKQMKRPFGQTKIQINQAMPFLPYLKNSINPSIRHTDLLNKFLSNQSKSMHFTQHINQQLRYFHNINLSEGIIPLNHQIPPINMIPYNNHSGNVLNNSSEGQKNSDLKQVYPLLNESNNLFNYPLLKEGNPMLNSHLINFNFPYNGRPLDNGLYQNIPFFNVNNLAYQKQNINYHPNTYGQQKRGRTEFTKQKSATQKNQRNK